MKNIIKRVLSILLAVVVTVGATPLNGLVGLELPDWFDFSKLFKVEAEAATSGYYTYTVSGGKATITDVNESISGAIIIPSTLGGYPVTSIGTRVFYNCNKLTSIIIPDGVTSIGNYAFYNCYCLTSITIPDSVTIIGNNAFRDCYSLTSVAIPDSVTSIETRVFYNCNKLTSVTIGDGVISIGDYAFYNCYRLTNITIPDSVTSIGDYAFYDCDSLASITIPDSVTSIGDYAFYNTSFYNNNSNWENSVLYIGNHLIRAKITLSGSYSVKKETKAIAGRAFYDCDSLASVTIPNSVISIGDYAFYDCHSLASIIIPEGVSKIGYVAFGNCDTLETVEFNAIDCMITNDYYHRGAFCGSENITSLKIGDKITEIPEYFMYEKKKLASVVIPSSVKEIGAYAFSKTALTTINLPSGVEIIGEKAFANIVTSTELTISESVKSINQRAFANNTALKKINFNAVNANDDPDNYSYYYGDVFANCGSQADGIELVFGDKVEKIPAFMFEVGSETAHPNIKNVVIGSNVTEIGDSAFRYCGSIENVEFGEKVETIGEYAFYSCVGLKSLELPESVKTISDDAFYSCNSLTEITISQNVESIGNSAFRNCEALKSLELPESIKTISDDAFYSCNSLTEITIPQNVESIGDSAFGNCTLVEKINFNAKNVINGSGDYWDSYFYNCGRDADGVEVIFGDSVENIPSYIFGGNDENNFPNIKSVVIGSNVTSIGGYAFYCCRNLENVEFGEKVEWIGNSAFSDCGALKSLELPESVKTISGDAFYSCNSLTEITISQNVESIGNRAFRNCEALKSLELPESIKTISDDAFYSCNSLTEITIPQNVESIGLGAFGYCSSVTTINYNATNCDSDYAFSGCKGVKTVNIGNNVESLSEYAFTGCGNLEKAYIPDIVINIHPLAFNDCGKVAIVCKNGSYANVFAVQNGIKYILEDNATGTAFEIRNDMLLGYSGSAQNIVLPSDISSVGLDAFKGNDVVKSIEIPYSVSKIYSGAFANCSKLERVVIPFTVTDISASAFAGTNAKIYCYYNSYAYNFAVANGIPCELIAITLSTNSVNVVETQSVTVDAVPSITLASGVPLVWKSNNPAVASVDSTGKIVGNGVGTTTVGVYDINGNMLDECSVTVDEKIKVEFEKPSTDTLKYGEKIILHINTANLPDGATVKWTTSDGKILKTSNVNAVCYEHTNCVTCTVESVGNGSAEITGTVVDKDGKPIEQGGEEITVTYQVNSKAGFFDKLIAFFKKLFGLLKTYSQ